MRLSNIQSIVFLFLVLIVAALFYMQVIRGGYYRDQSRNNRIRAVVVEGPRGRIMDRNGVVLADNRSAFHIGVVPQDIQDNDVFLII